MLTVVAAIFIFLMVIVFHEFGHFIVAKMVGIKVNEFSIGMGPKIFQNEKGETKYTLRALPIGGYVSMEGEDEESNDPRSFNNALPLSRIAVVVAGAIMNFVLAIIVFSIVSYSVGMPSTTVYKTQKGSPAEEIGISSGDQIININGKEINNWNEISEEMSKSNPEENMDIVILRDGKTIKYTLKPEINEENRVIIGIEPEFEKSFLLAIKGGFQKTGAVLKLMFDFIKMVFRGQVSTKDLSGPVGVIYAISETAKYGIINLLYLLGFISVNLGFFNLLPIPALDGSRIVFLIVEMVRGKSLDPEKEGFIHFIGFVLLIVLMIAVTYSDIIRFSIFRR